MRRRAGGPAYDVLAAYLGGLPVMNRTQAGGVLAGLANIHNDTDTLLYALRDLGQAPDVTSREGEKADQIDLRQAQGHRAAPPPRERDAGRRGVRRREARSARAHRPRPRDAAPRRAPQRQLDRSLRWLCGPELLVPPLQGHRWVLPLGGPQARALRVFSSAPRSPLRFRNSKNIRVSKPVLQTPRSEGLSTDRRIAGEPPPGASAVSRRLRRQPSSSPMV